MDLDGQDGEKRDDIPAPDNECRLGGFRSAWKRLRSALTPRRANKAPKRSSTQVAAQAENSRDIQTPSPSPSPKPPHTSYDASGPSLSQELAEQSRYCIQSKQGAERTTLDHSSPVTAFPDRPRLPQSAASEGNLITCPTNHVLPDRSRPNSDASGITYDSLPPPRTGREVANGQHVTLPNRRDRAASLFGKYGLALDPDSHFSESAAPEEVQSVQRVTKPAKVRVHYHCHKCNMAIGSNGICIQCGHKRCKECGRWPPRRSHSGSRSSRGDRRSLPPPVIPSTRTETLDAWLSNARPSTQCSNRTFSNLFSHNDVLLTRNIRRLCHKCHSPFIWTQTRCQDCNHTLCYACPREPAQTASGSSSPRPATTRIRERVFKKPRIRVRYNCDQCMCVFEEGTKKCSGCGHLRCENCVRWPPRSEPSREPDAAAVEAFRRRMETMP